MERILERLNKLEAQAVSSEKLQQETLSSVKRMESAILGDEEYGLKGILNRSQDTDNSVKRLEKRVEKIETSERLKKAKISGAFLVFIVLWESIKFYFQDFFYKKGTQ